MSVWDKTGFQSLYMQTWCAVKAFLRKCIFLNSCSYLLCFHKQLHHRSSVFPQTLLVKIPVSFITTISTKVNGIANYVLNMHWILYKTNCLKISVLFFSKSRLFPIPDSPDTFLNSFTAFPSHISWVSAPSFLNCYSQNYWAFVKDSCREISFQRCLKSCHTKPIFPLFYNGV